jgi:hypothetical protein
MGMADQFSLSVGQNKGIAFPFRFAVIDAAPLTTTTISAFEIRADNLGDRVSAVSDLYTHFRVKQLRAKISSDRSPGNLFPGYLHLAYVNKYTATTVTSIAEMIDFPSYNDCHPNNIAELFVAPDTLNDKLLPWFLTRDNGDNNLHIQGVLYRAVYNAETVASTWTSHMIVEGIIEFKGSVDPVINPKPVSSRSVDVSDCKVGEINTSDGFEESLALPVRGRGITAVKSCAPMASKGQIPAQLRK